MQWAFHDSPPVPSPANDDDIDSLLSGSLHRSHAEQGSHSNPRTSTVLFTPLREYKLRGTFATPYLVLTHYTDLAQTHGVVLLRGEITPYSAASAAGAAIQGVEGQNLLTQHDAQRLAMALQRFYLWDQGKGDAERLLRLFHETPEQFEWTELLKYAEVGA
jgi:ATP synthase F1 complex assembly factor 1